MEGDLAFYYTGTDSDLRNLYRPGSGMTPRRLVSLIGRLPSDAWVWAEQEAAEKAALKPTEDKIRERQEFYAQKRREAEEPSQ